MPGTEFTINMDVAYEWMVGSWSGGALVYDGMPLSVSSLA